MPPNLLAHYLYLCELTAVRQAIETAWISASADIHRVTGASRVKFLAWAGGVDDDPIAVQCAALQMLIEHVWRLKLVPGEYRLLPQPIEIRDGQAPPVGSNRLRGTLVGPRLWWLCRLPPGNYKISPRLDGGSELAAGINGHPVLGR
jgi:hypothetical protein